MAEFQKSDHERILALEQAYARYERVLDAGEGKEVGGAPYVVHNYAFPADPRDLHGGTPWPQANLKHCESTRIHENVGNADDTVNVTLKTATGSRTGTWQVFSAPRSHSGAPPSGTSTTDWTGADTGISKGPITVKNGEWLHVHYENPNHPRDDHNVQWLVT